MTPTSHETHSVTTRLVETPTAGAIVLTTVLPLVGLFVWFIKIQGALNRYWESKGATPA